MFEPRNEISINDLVPPDMRVRDDYRTVRDVMKRNLADQNKVSRYATHESGHLIYLVKTGLVSSAEDAVFAGPTIYWEGGVVKHFMAAVTSKHVRLSDKNLDYTKELLDKISLAATAAGVFEEMLLGADDNTAKATEGDKHTFYEHCYKAREDGIFNGRLLWDSAYLETTEWVQKHRADVEALVGIAKQVIFKKCFGLKVELSSKDFAVNHPHDVVSSLLLRLLFE